MMQPNPDLIEDIRGTSRRLVRELGFMQSSLAGTGLPPSAVHALIEIDAREGITARDLARLLGLDKSSVSRVLHKLVGAGDVAARAGAGDGRTRALALTDRGRERVAAIHAFARARVAGALATLPDGAQAAVRDGLALYAGALGAGAGPSGPAPILIAPGYRPGLIARVTAMHVDYYARAHGFGARFEARVAGGLAEFCPRLDRPANGIWTAVRDGRVLGSIAIDGEDLGEGRAHLHWFVVDGAARGTGAGRRLLEAALAFADARGFAETHLWTFAGLDAARHLYEAHGFACTGEWSGDQWGPVLSEQRFVRRRGAR